MQRYGGAAPGMRTMLDALCPAITAARTALERLGADAGWAALEAAASAASAGALATRSMEPQAGRASYRVEHGSLRDTADPGATAVALALAGLLQLKAVHVAVDRIEIEK